jgi:hypothetical protein
MKKPKPTCSDCRHAKFQLTPTGKVKKGLAGVCKYPIPEDPILPIAVTQAYGYLTMKQRYEHKPRGGMTIWHNWTDCPTFGAKEED